MVAKLPGSHHNSFAMDVLSALHDRFENSEFGESSMLADSGYGLKRWLMTPYANLQTESGRRFNAFHRKTQCAIEQSFGVLNSRWRILVHTKGNLCYTPAKFAKIVITSCMLLINCWRNGTPSADANSSHPIFSPCEEDDRSEPTEDTVKA